MDKYTVDLDQVLNDFEYSELTDQQGNNKPHTAAFIQNSLRNSSPVVKHSINNVFHSLNEYLNTEISKPQVDRKSAPPGSPPGSPSSSDSEDGQVYELAEDLGASDSSIETINNELELDEAKEEVGEILEGIIDVVLEDKATETVEEREEVAKEAVREEVEAPKFEVKFEESFTRIGFDADVDLDEAELHQYLDDLEKEFDESHESVVEETVKDNDDNKPEGRGRKNSIERVAEESAVHVEEVAAVATTIITQKPPEERAVGEAEVAEGPVENGRARENVENGGDLDDDKDEEIEVLTEEVEREAETLRPNNLPLSEEKSVINLIGDPGSTPYNNVYVNKELPDEVGSKPSEDGTGTNVSEECSTSASPTFSDISTETTSSCTTDTANDDDDIAVGVNTSTDVVPEVSCQTGSGGEKVTAGDIVVTSAVDVPRTETTEELAPAAAAAETTEAEVRESENETSVAAPVEEDNAPRNDMTHWLGKQAPLWIPDADAQSCLHCDMKFTVIKRRHHCRACGLVLCSKCCSLRHRLEYLDEVARVCTKCHDILSRGVGGAPGGQPDSSSGSEQSSPGSASNVSGRGQHPNPNNPSEYCSTVPPHQQMAGGGAASNPPSVMVPVGVLKRKGSGKARTNKSVMFCDGIRPGSDLTNLDSDFGYTASAGGDLDRTPSSKVAGVKGATSVKRSGDPAAAPATPPVVKANRNAPPYDQETRSYIPSDGGLPPTVTIMKTDISYSECSNGPNVVEMLRNELLTFCLQLNLFVHLKIINMDCCINKLAWCFSTEGLINVGQDEIVILLEVMDDEKTVPKEVFFHINNIYSDALKGNSVKEMGLSLHNTSTFLDSKNHAGFLFIRPTFQCLQNVVKPKEPYLIGILIHRWETPWAKLFPLRLILRLGAEYRYYPSPIISNRFRDSVFVEIGHTIINLLADFRNFSYTLPQIRGLTIHMEDKNTTVMIPVNRYDQVMKSMNNSSDHILAFAGNFSNQADSHLVCIQDTQSNENAYSTHAINIHNKPRKVTGASFIVFNGALKSSSGLTAKSSIVEDGLMIQIPSDHMQQIRESLRNMKDHTIQCGCINAASDETVNIIWGEADVNFNLNVISPIDDQSMSGVPSIRVHNGKDYVCNSGNRLIRWTEVFIIQNVEESSNRNQDPVDISKVSESIAKATCTALVKYLDLLVSNNFYKIGIRTTLHVENVSYSAGSNAMKLPPIYMKSLDNELIPVLHRITSNNFGDNAIILELIFRILNK